MRLLGAESSSIPGVRLRVLVEGMTAQTPCKRLFLRAILRHVSPASGPGKRIAQEAVRPIRHLSCSLLSVSLPVARSPALAGEANPPAATENKLRWSLVAMIPRLELTALECRRVAETLQSWLEDSSSIVKTCALQGLADLTRQDPSLQPMVLDLLRIHSRSGTPAMRARGRMLLHRLETS